MGSANVIPGLSGGTIAVITRKYARFISIIGNLLPNLKSKNKAQLKSDFAFLIPYVLGIIVGIFVFAILLNLLFTNFIVATSFAFMGLIIGTLPELFKEANAYDKPKASSYISFALTLIFALVLAYFKIFGDFKQMESIAPSFVNAVILLVFGFLAAGAMVIPGISGSLVLMLLGGYKLVLSSVANILDFSIFTTNLFILAPFAVGVLIGFFAFSYLMTKLLAKYYTATYYGILGFCIGSIPCLYPGLKFNTEGYIAIILLIVFTVLSWLITVKARKLREKKEREEEQKLIDEVKKEYDENSK